MIRALGMYEESLERFVSAQELDERARDFSALIEAQYTEELSLRHAVALARGNWDAVTDVHLADGTMQDSTTLTRTAA
jgi:hypothetical protein